MNSEKLEFGYESVSILASFFVNAGGKIHPCRSVIVDFGLSDINPGMVPDGAKCGEDKVRYAYMIYDIHGLVLVCILPLPQLNRIHLGIVHKIRTCF